MTGHRQPIEEANLIEQVEQEFKAVLFGGIKETVAKIGKIIKVKLMFTFQQQHWIARV